MTKSIEPWKRSGIAVLVLAVAAGAALRLYDLSAPSFAEDELYKVRAVQSYERGQWTLTGDDEHPLLLKLLILGAHTAAAAWNEHVASPGSVLEVALETSTRIPNALVGAFTALLLAFLGRQLFSRRAGLCAALLWAVEPNVIGYSRIAKEDTLLAFFLVWMLYWVVRAKHAAETGDSRGRRYEIFAAVTLGGLCASKYFPHLTFIAPLFYVWCRLARDTTWRVSLSRWAVLVAVAMATFLIINPTAIHPDNLRYMFGYANNSTVYHHGVPFMGELRMNNWYEGLSGTPWHYWFVYLGVKLSVPLLAAVVAGVVLALRGHRSDGPRILLVWLGVWLLVHSLMGAKYARFLPHLMPPLVLLAAFALVSAASKLSELLARRGNSLRGAVAAAGLLALVGAPLAYAGLQAAPHYRMWLNLFGGAGENLRHYFPHCDFYDVGVREAVQYVCAHAPQGAQLALESPYVGTYYLERCGRKDIDVVVLSKPNTSCDPARPCYRVLQESQRHFETQPLFDRLHASRAPDATIRVRGVNVAEIYGPDPGPAVPGEQALRLQELARVFGNAASGPPVVIESREPPRMAGVPVLTLALVSRFRFAGEVAIEEPSTVLLPQRRRASVLGR